ncbi:HTH-type transcriptional activator CmpR [Peptococcaceae bacterium CEB3]|nr:HTH-type transcriptional activator CmpR [Peptococcaceae bacterium CEB3]
MNFHQLHIFNVVAKHRSYSKAAAELYLSQPTVSVHLQKLEQDLGMELFEQLGRNIYLTDAGRMLFGYTQKIFTLAEEAERALEELQGLHKGRIRLGAGTTAGIYYLPDLLGQFKEDYPGIELVLDVANSSEIEKKVLANQLDIGVIGCLSTEPDLVSEPFRRDRLLMILSPQHPLLKKDEISLEDIARQRFILREPGSSTRRAIEDAFSRRGIHLQVAMEYASTDGIKYAVAANLGVSIVSELAVRLCEQTGLVAVRELPELEITRPFSLIYHKDKHLSPLSQTFVKAIKDYASQEAPTDD